MSLHMRVISLTAVALSRVRRELQKAAATRDWAWLDELDALVRLQLERAFNDPCADEAHLSRELTVILRTYAHLACPPLPPRRRRRH